MDGAEHERVRERSGTPNRRMFFRAPLEWRGAYELHRAAAAEAQTFWALDLSPTGAAIELHGETPGVGEHLTLRFEDSMHYDAYDLVLRARAVNQRRHPNPRVFGVMFEGLTTAQRDELARIVFVAQRDVLRLRHAEVVGDADIVDPEARLA